MIRFLLATQKTNVRKTYKQRGCVKKATAHFQVPGYVKCPCSLHPTTATPTSEMTGSSFNDDFKKAIQFEKRFQQWHIKQEVELEATRRTAARALKRNDVSSGAPGAQRQQKSDAKGVPEAAGLCRTPPNRSRTAAKSIREPSGMFPGDPGPPSDAPGTLAGGAGMLLGRFQPLPGRIRDIPRTVRKAAGAPG